MRGIGTMAIPVSWFTTLCNINVCCGFEKRKTANIINKVMVPPNIGVGLGFRLQNTKSKVQHRH